VECRIWFDRKGLSRRLQVEAHRSRLRGPPSIRWRLRKKSPENGENGARRRWTSTFLIRANLTGSESKGEMFEPGQRGKASDHPFR
jgi:hypothetical protein